MNKERSFVKLLDSIILKLAFKFNKVIFEDIIPVGERVRDIIFIKEKNAFLLMLESIPAIGVLSLIN